MIPWSGLPVKVNWAPDSSTPGPAMEKWIVPNCPGLNLPKTKLLNCVQIKLAVTGPLLYSSFFCTDLLPAARDRYAKQSCFICCAAPIKREFRAIEGQ